MRRRYEDEPDKQRGFGPVAVDLLASFWHDPLDYDTDAAKRPIRRTRFTRALTAVTAAVIGFLLVVAYQHTIAAAPANAEIRDQLIADINSRQAETDRMQDDAEQLGEDVESLRDELLGNDAEAEALDNQAALAGLAAVEGDGVTVTVSDGPKPEDPSAQDLGRVIDRDIQTIVNTLWSLGAEAIAIDEQRLTATSAIRAAGAAILVDFRPVTDPYTITAIGPPDLAREFNATPTAHTFDNYSNDYGMGFTVKATDDLTLPAAPAPPLDNAAPLLPPGTVPDPSGSASGR
ncbi:DUF881 domain-containing protein [Phytomonospora endophytica]|uniref:Uncharacterized protein YlxW (UPF0749 family) n=1 Tax=Phytomonospora endophytica TaxID=714109 RepID=A0A841FPW5_9ACTN|nr:DUF881 domain-containing protein [Phytomonospora endophytica]MBB6035838.1 uncharacterized protein YlxW (UPF0749 family) [Phytomonospora endophytica]GIG71517.1 hypothetical protein Pen01_78120 [Phytomonospora endophytica]